MSSAAVMRVAVARAFGLMFLVCFLAVWFTSDCAGVGFHGGGMAGGAGMRMGGGFSPSVGSFGGARPMAMPRMSPPMGNLGGFEHGAIPAFPQAAGPAFRPSGGATAAQLGSFLGLPGGLSPSGRPVTPAGPSRVGPGPSWSAGYAGNRPSWAGSSGDAASRFRNAVQPGAPNATQLHNWLNNNPQRAEQWKNRGDQIRQRWANGDRPPVDRGVMPGSDWWSKYHPDMKDHPLADRGVIPGSDWWSKYHPKLDNWYYHHGWNHHGWGYWWGVPTWAAFGTWFPAWGWTEPVFYDYGEGGNVVYQNDDVYVNGQDVGTAADYAKSAADLATVDPQQAQTTPADEDWMALGTFTVVTSEKDTDPTRILQLAVDRQGIISGTMYNSSTDQTYVVQGRVDKDTQRVAFTVGDKSDVVMETGIYNLTQQQTPVLVHFGTDRTEHYLLVRLSAPPAADEPKADASGPAAS